RRANVSLRDSFPQRGRSEWIAGATHPAPGARAPGVQRRHPAPLNAASACWCAGADLGKEGIEVRLEERLPVNEAHRLGVDLDLVGHEGAHAVDAGIFVGGDVRLELPVALAITRDHLLVGGQHIDAAREVRNGAETPVRVDILNRQLAGLVARLQDEVAGGVATTPTDANFSAVG